MSEFERVILMKNEVFVFRLPPRQSARGVRAADWKLDNPDWTGRMRIIDVNKQLILKFEDRSSGELFAKCPVDAYPGLAIEPVLDSSRYFVVRLRDDAGKTAFVGIGFTDRNDSFDMNVCIQDYFKQLNVEKTEQVQQQQQQQEPPVNLDLGFKQGQTITLNLQTKRSGDSKVKSSLPKTGNTLGGGLLPPPPSKHRNNN